jgi:hypothetical protein
VPRLVRDENLAAKTWPLHHSLKNALHPWLYPINVNNKAGCLIQTNP